MSKNYYDILGVDKNASKDEIKKAFRKKAHELHPDKATGDEAKFKEVNEAYQVLGDEQKRAQYDQFGSGAFDGSGAGGFGGFGGAGVNFEDLGDIFGDFFGGGFGGGSSRGQKRGQEIEVMMKLSFNEAVFGTQKELSLTKNSTCERCAGNGAEPGSAMKTCDSCKGAGYTVRTVNSMFGAMQQKVHCSACDGTGEIPEQKCTTCHGEGVEYGRKTIRVDVPAGVENGNRIRLRGQGEAVKGGVPGDLYILLRVEDDARFVREGQTIYSEVEIGFTQAALGDSLQVDTVDGKVKLTVPAGTQSGEKLRLKGKGIPGVRGGRGDHIVIVKVVTPKKLSKKQRQTLEQLDLRA